MANSVSFLEKAAGGSAPSDFRPLTVTPIIYRIWAKLRCRDLADWQTAWCQPSQHGFIKNRSPDTAATSLGAWLEIASDENAGLHVANFDLSKAFDTVPWRLAVALLSDAGAPPGIIHAITACYLQTKICFKCRKWCSQYFTPENGVKQGCPLSGLLLNALLSPVLAKLLESFPESFATAYADDVTLAAKSTIVLQQMTEVWAEFTDFTRQKLNAAKTAFITSTANSPPLVVNGTEVQPTLSMRYLGAQLECKDGKPCWQILPKKVDDLYTICRKIGSAGWPWNVRCAVMRGYAIPKCLSAIGVASLPGAQAGAITNAIQQALWAKPGTKRSGAILLGVFGHGHATHPTIVTPVRRIMAIARTICVGSFARNLLAACLRIPADRTQHTSGPRGLMRSLSKAYHMRFKPDGKLHAGNIVLDPLVPEQMAAIPHVTRGIARARLWKVAAQTRLSAKFGRDELRGIEAGIDLDTVRRIYNKVDLRWQGSLRYVLTGAFHPPVPRLEDGSWDRHCLYCSSPNPTLVHTYWHCPAWDMIRNRRRLPRMEDFPPCFQNCGLPTPGIPESTVVNVQATMVGIFQATLADLEAIPSRWRWLPRPTTYYNHRAPPVHPAIPADVMAENEGAVAHENSLNSELNEVYA